MSWIIPIIKTVVPKVTKFINDGVQGLDGDDELSDTTFRNVGLQRTLDSPVTEDDKKKEECLIVTNEEISRREVIKSMIEQARVEHLVLGMPLDGLTKSQVVVSCEYSFTFGPNATNLDQNYIGKDDHVSFQLTPRNYHFFSQLGKHELVKFNNCHITSQLTSAYDASTLVAFIPVVKNTDGISLDILSHITKKAKYNQGEPVDYTIRYVSPSLVEYDTETKQFKTLSNYLEPNKVVRVSYIQDIYKENPPKMFSYGTIIVIKQNTSNQTISCNFKIDMTFDVWDYLDNSMSIDEAQRIYQAEIDNNDNDGNEKEDEGKENSTTSSQSFRTRRTKK